MSEISIDEFVRQLALVCSFDISTDATPYDDLTNDLGIDSVQIYELIVIVEAMAGCLEPPLEIPALLTLADAFDYYWQCRPTP